MSAMASQITSLTIVYSRRRSKKASKLPVTGLCEGNSPVISEFPAQRASNAGNVSIWWRHHVLRGQYIPNLYKHSPRWVVFCFGLVPGWGLLQLFTLFPPFRILYFVTISLKETHPWSIVPMCCHCHWSNHICACYHRPPTYEINILNSFWYTKMFHTFLNGCICYV